MSFVTSGMICGRSLGTVTRKRFLRRVFGAKLEPWIRFALTRQFSAFTPRNDPHGEHDFGNFEIAGQKFFWKIDYYDERMEFGSENPNDPGQTTRVLTIMLASEY